MYIIIKLTLSFIRLFPSKLLVKIVHTSLILKQYRKQVINNNYNSTIGSGLSKVEFSNFYKQCLLNISKILIETLKFDSTKTSKLSYLNIQELEKRCKLNNGLILMASHYGNWELACTNLPLHTSLPCYGVYKPLKNKALDQELLQIRSRFGLKLIPMNSIARSISANYNSVTPAIYILIADQNPRSIQNVVWIKFLGVLSAFSNGPAKIQGKYNFPIAYMKTTPGKEIFEYNIDFEFPDSEDSKKSMQWYSQRVENQINNNAYNWLWSHKRWKRKHPSSIT